MKQKQFTRGPVTAQKNAEAGSAFDRYSNCGKPNPLSMFFSGPRVLFGTPEEDAAAATAATEAKLATAIEAKLEAKYGKVINNLSAQLRRLEEPAKQTTEKKEDDDDGRLSNKEEIAKLKAERAAEKAAAAAEKNKNAEKSRKLELRRTIAEKGVTGEAARDLEARILLDHGGRLKNRDDDSVVVEDETGADVDLATFLDQTFLKGAAGDRYRTSPDVGTEGARGLKPSQRSGGGERKMFGELTPAEQDKLFTDGKAAEYVKADMASGR